MRRQVKLTEQRFYGLVVLLGQENRDWEYYETDPDWWAIRLRYRRN